MADPHIKETLDLVDKVSISIYRSGMILTGIALFCLAIQQLFYPLWFKQVMVLLAFSAMLMASSLHIYMKSVRWILVNATWMGIWLLSLSFVTTGGWALYLSLGAFIVTLSGLAYKESFCFSLLVLKLIPVLLVISWISVLFSQSQLAAVTLFLSSFLYLYMAWKKINMPLHFDLGDRSKYEV